MKFSVILFFFCCGCSLTGRNWYITEIDKENKDECKEIIRERPYRNKLYKKVVYRIKKECRDDYRQRKKEQ